MTYSLLNLVFVAISMVVIMLLRGSTSLRSVLFTTLALLVLSLIGDNFIVATGIVEYDPTKIAGLRVGVAPVEDFAYALVAGALVPVIWNRLGKRK